jgi:beta-lactamase regulating signal transducer with metallopeptidase domain
MTELPGFGATWVDTGLYTGLGAAALMSAGLLAYFVALRSGPALRHTILAAALVAALALPAVRALSSIASRPDAVALPATPDFEWTPDPASPGGPVTAPGDLLLLEASMGGTGAATWLLLAWTLGSIALGTRYAFGWAAVRRTAARGVPLDRQAWTEEVRQLARGERIATPGLVHVAAGSTPFVSGVGRPTIVIPTSYLDASPDERWAILLHELAHIRRRDTIWLLVAAAARCLYWPLPQVWWLTARLRLESERVCDEAVLRGGVPRREYVRQLMRASGNRAIATGPVWAPGLGTPELYRRLYPLASGHLSSPPRRWARGLVGLLALVATLEASTWDPPANRFELPEGTGVFFFDPEPG